MITAIGTLLDLVTNFLQHPVESIVIFTVVGVIMYTVEQKMKEPPHHEDDHE
ncbi:MAG: hypothetical protein KF716_20780 [Anaerolineae bacterium]|nr:hypothetical protein [Anaerolineae bacterium]